MMSSTHWPKVKGTAAAAVGTAPTARLMASMARKTGRAELTILIVMKVCLS